MDGESAEKELFEDESKLPPMVKIVKITKTGPDDDEQNKRKTKKPIAGKLAGINITYTTDYDISESDLDGLVEEWIKSGWGKSGKYEKGELTYEYKSPDNKTTIAATYAGGFKIVQAMLTLVDDLGIHDETEKATKKVLNDPTLIEKWIDIYDLHIYRRSYDMKHGTLTEDYENKGDILNTELSLSYVRQVKPANLKNS